MGVLLRLPSTSVQRNVKSDVSPNTLPKLGIIAGGGNLPKDVIAGCVKSNRDFFVIAIKGQTDEDTPQDHPHAWVKTGAIGKALKLLKHNGAEDLVMVGYYKRPAWKDIRPDFIGAKWLTKFVTQLGKDDGILRLVIKEFETEGFNVLGVDQVLGDEILAKKQTYTKKAPSKDDWISIDRGLEVLEVLGKVDVGQSIIVQEGAVVGVEAMEGTDQLINRCKDLHPAGPKNILIKCMKPYQDQRIDRPVIGPKTIHTAIDAGLKGIAVQAGEVIIMDEQKLISQANKAGLFIVGV